MVLKTDIPIVDGVDVTKYQNIPRSVDYFFDIPEEMPKYIANVNKEGYGLLQVSTKRLRSRKLFSWGKCNASDHWQEFLTDQAGRYVEIQAGLAKTQYGCLPMAPHAAWEWVERYGPVQVDPEMLDKSGKERTAWLTGMFNAHAVILPESAKIADVYLACRKVGIFLNTAQQNPSA